MLACMSTCFFSITTEQLLCKNFDGCLGKIPVRGERERERDQFHDITAQNIPSVVHHQTPQRHYTHILSWPFYRTHATIDDGWICSPRKACASSPSLGRGSSHPPTPHNTSVHHHKKNHPMFRNMLIALPFPSPSTWRGGPGGQEMSYFNAR
jgi:hypothetical protein